MTTQTTKTTTLRAKDLSCPSCVAKIEGALTAIAGVDSAEVKFNSGRIIVNHDPAAVRVSDLIAAVKSAGYVAEPSAF